MKAILKFLIFISVVGSICAMILCEGEARSIAFTCAFSSAAFFAMILFAFKIIGFIWSIITYPFRRNTMSMSRVYIETDDGDYRMDNATQRQKSFIRELGGIPRDDLTKGEASDMIEFLLAQRDAKHREETSKRFKHVKSMAIGAALFFCALTAFAAEWKVTSCTDPITDEEVNHLHAFGTSVASSDGSYCPILVVRIIPNGFDELRKKMIYTPDVYVWCPVFMRKKSDTDACLSTTERFDKNKPTTAIWRAADNPCAYFCENGTNTFEGLLKSRTLAMKISFYDREFVTTFDLSGLKDIFCRVEREYLTRIGKWSQPKKMVKTCYKCKGKGVISAWVKCTDCGGRGTNSGGRCRTCVNSAKTGHVKSDVPCQKCAPPKDRGADSYAYSSAIYWHKQALAQAERIGELDSIAGGYYEHAKNMFKAKRINPDGQGRSSGRRSSRH